MIIIVLGFFVYLKYFFGDNGISLRRDTQSRYTLKDSLSKMPSIFHVLYNAF